MASVGISHLIIFLFVFASAFLISLAFFVYHFFTKKSTKSPFISLVISGLSCTIIVIVTSIKLIKLVEYRYKDFKKRNKSIEFDLFSIFDDNRNYIINEKNSNADIKKIISYEPIQFKGKAPQEYYTYFGYYDWYRMPLVYPFSMNSIDNIEYGHLANEENINSLKTDFNDTEQIFCCSIKRFTFDRTLFLGILTPQYNDSVGVQYVMMEFNNGSTQYFDSKKELLEAAAQKNFNGSKDFISVREYWNKF